MIYQVQFFLVLLKEEEEENTFIPSQILQTAISSSECDIIGLELLGVDPLFF